MQTTSTLEISPRTGDDAHSLVYAACYGTRALGLSFTALDTERSLARFDIVAPITADAEDAMLIALGALVDAGYHVAGKITFPEGDRRVVITINDHTRIRYGTDGLSRKV